MLHHSYKHLQMYQTCTVNLHASDAFFTSAMSFIGLYTQTCTRVIRPLFNFNLNLNMSSI